MKKILLFIMSLLISVNVSVFAQEQCQASFTYSIDSLNGNYVYVFTDQSVGTVSTWLWDFGDGTSSSLQNPTHQYSTVNPPFSVCLNIVTVDSCFSWFCDTIYNDIQDTCKLYIAYQVKNVSTAGGNDGSIDITVAGGTTPYNYEWSTGETSEDISGLTIGTYIVKVTDAKGCVKWQNILVNVQGNNNDTACWAYFEYYIQPDSNNIGDSITCIQFVSYSNTKNTEYLWDFGDGSTSTAHNPYHCYPYFGKYDVCLTITSLINGTSCSDQYCKEIIIGNDPCKLYIQGIINNPSGQNMADGSICLNVAGGTAPYSFQWDYGTVNNCKDNLSEGYYCVLVTDAKGCTSYGCYTVYYDSINSIDTSFGQIDTCIVINGLDTAYIDSVSIQNGKVKLFWVVIDNTGQVITFTSDQLDILKSGNYYVVLTIYCKKSTIIINGKIVVDFTIGSVQDMDPNRYTIAVYPNPVNDILSVSMPFSEKGITDITILNAFGQVIKQEQFNKTSGDSIYMMDVNELRNGIYFIKVAVNNNSVAVMRFVK